MITTREGLDIYTSGTADGSKSAIVFFADVFGWHGGHLRTYTDELASEVTMCVYICIHIYIYEKMFEMHVGRCA